MIDLKKAPKRSRNGIIAGVAAGFAKNFDVDPFWVRLGMVLLLPASFGTMVIVYVVLAFIMDVEPAK